MPENDESKVTECDGGFACGAAEHIEGCYTGEGHPAAVQRAPSCGCPDRYIAKETEVKEQLYADIVYYGALKHQRASPETLKLQADQIKQSVELLITLAREVGVRIEQELHL